jgi:hypothetical protein
MTEDGTTPAEEWEVGTKTLEVQQENGKPFRLTVPKASRVTFGPWSPPSKDGAYDRQGRALTGTLRVYAPGPKTSDNVLAVFSGVTGFRDLSIDYSEQVAVEVGSIVWNSDKRGYSREEKVTRDEKWEPKGLPSGDDKDDL